MTQNILLEIDFPPSHYRLFCRHGMKFNVIICSTETLAGRTKGPYLHHDDKINPRSIGNSIRGLIEEFHRKRPQLHVPLAWVDLTEKGGGKVRLFDGQVALVGRLSTISNDLWW